MRTAVFYKLKNLRMFIKTKEESVLLLELPDLKSPRWKNVGITVFDKARLFLVGAGKIIVAISIVLWALGTFGPTERIQSAVQKIEKPVKKKQLQSVSNKKHRDLLILKSLQSASFFLQEAANRVLF